MDITSIEKFLDPKTKRSKIVNLHFKDRATVTGIFIITTDHQHLKNKNFWRVVSIKNIEQWDRTKNLELSRLFNGAAFSRLSSV